MFIIIYGNMVMKCDRRKTNRIIEIIISSVKPFQLMIGKIIGTSLAGILQFFIWALIGLFFIVCRICVLELTWGQRVSPELMEQAQQEFAGTAQMYIKELWNLLVY
jgi:ABC-2 type transport system permease protein